MSTTSTSGGTQTQRDPWHVIARRKQDQRSRLVPKEWLIPRAKLQEYNLGSPRANVTDVPVTCGILTPRELEITGDHDAVSLLDALRRGPDDKGFTATEVVTAFCKRAAIAQQVVNTQTGPPLLFPFYSLGSLDDDWPSHTDSGVASRQTA